MFSFFGSKKKTEEKKEPVAVSGNADELRARAAELIKKLPTATSKQEKVKLLNEIGSCYFKAGDKDDAINYYEQSLAEDKQLGKAYTDLLKLYNQKRQEAAEAKDDAKIKEYLGKVQELMQTSKDVIRGKV